MAGDTESKTAIALVDPLVGSVFDKRFRVEEQIATGGFGAIYRATHVKSGHPIALKVLLPTLAQDLGIVARFRREGDTLTALRNPHTITAYELGQAADRTLYIVMELLHGESLFERYETGGPLDWRRMARIARQVCESLAEAHALGIVHRDLKPTNIHLEDVNGDPDFVKVLDFGIAKILQGSDGFDSSDITNAGTMIGTLDYMSPEQMVGGQVTGQTDIYTLGIVMYEMIAGTRPFPEAKTAAAALGAMLKTVPEPLYLRAPVPEEMSKIVMRSLERESQKRYRSVGELMNDLDEVIGERGASGLIDQTTTVEVAARLASESGDDKATNDDEATMFTPPPERLLESMRTPRVERIAEWEDDDENAKTAASRHDEHEVRAASRVEANVRDGVDPHGPTIAVRTIEDSGNRTPVVRREPEPAKPSRRQSESDMTTVVVRDADEGARTPTFPRSEPDSETAPRPRTELAKSLSRAKSAPSPTSSPEPVRGRQGTRPPPTPDPEASRARQATRPPPTPDPDAARGKPARSATAQPSPIPPTPPVRPLQARGVPTPVPSIVVAPFSSTPRAATSPPIPMPAPGSLPPGVPMPPRAPTHGELAQQRSARVPTPPGMAPFQGPPANPFVPGATPGSNPSANPFTASGAPGSNPFMPPSPLPPTANPPSSLPPTGHPVMPRPQYDMSRMAAREALIRRLVWIAVIVLGTSIGFLVAMRL